MIKPGKACSQLMKANNTSETKIKVVGKHFRLTLVFNVLKTPQNIYFNSLQVLSLLLFFKIRGVLSVKTCLEGGNLVNLTMHAPRYITGCPSNIFNQTTCKGQACGAAKALLCRNIMEACEAREHGSDSKKNHQVEGVGVLDRQPTKGSTRSR
jgi:hypothetical protein